MAETRAEERRGTSDAARLLLAAARERFAGASADLLLPDRARLDEWQRIAASALLAQLVQGIEDDLRAALADRFADHELLHAALGSKRVPIARPLLERASALRDPELMALLVRRVEAHRFWRDRPDGAEDPAARLVADPDPEIASDAMSLILARSRRVDPHDEPMAARAELPAELQHRLVWLIAAALRHYIVQQHRVNGVDAAVEAAAAALVAAYDEAATVDALAARLVRRLQEKGRLDGALLARFASGGDLPMLIAGLAAACGLESAAAWEVLADPNGQGPALLVRAARIARPEAAEIFLALNMRGAAFSGAEGEGAAAQLELYDTLDPPSADEVLRLWKANPAYRASVARLSTRRHRADTAP